MKERAVLFLVIAGTLLLAGLSGCGPASELRKAERLEKKGFYIEAGRAYEQLYRHHPGHSLAPEALYRAGMMYRDRLKLYSQARRYFTNLLEVYGSTTSWAPAARRALFDSPDYFPLDTGNAWVEGDSETGGKNMRAEWSCQEVSSGTFAITQRLFAGNRFVTQVRRFYRKENLELREYGDLRAREYSVLISYPFVEGRRWRTTEEGRPVIHEIVSTTAAVRIRAGEFANCLKVSETSPALPGSVQYNYYAPGVGWVLTTVAGAGGTEHNNTELLSHRTAAR